MVTNGRRSWPGCSRDSINVQVTLVNEIAGWISARMRRRGHEVLPAPFGPSRTLQGQ
jgi:hypothetical protein